MLFFHVMRDILPIVIQFAAVMFAISVHEAAHAWTADRFGDPTAKLQGRVTLNPIPHIDLIGTIIFPLLLAVMGQPVFGWAKPVMVNPYNLRNPRRDHMFIAAAGPISNLVVAFTAIVLFLILKKLGLYVMAGGLIEVVAAILFYLIIINVFLAIFNLIPIPPLDGSGILEGLLKGEALRMYLSLKPYGFIILIGIIYLGLFQFIAQPVFMLIRAILSL